MKALLIITISVFTSFFSISQKPDSSLYTSYRNRLVLYSFTGFQAAPFSIKDDFKLGVTKIKFKHNFQPILGFGMAYKWFKFRFGFSLPINMRSVEKYGSPKYTNLAFSFNIKQVYLGFDLKSYRGFVIQNAYHWNDTLTADNPSDFRPNTSTSSITVDFWYFKTPGFKMPTNINKVGHFNESKGSFFINAKINVFGAGNKDEPLVPLELIDSTQSKSAATTIGSVDFAVIPGYAYVHRYKNFRVGGVFGVGAAVQTKFYESFEASRGFLGLAPRVDLRLLVGITKKDYFIWLISGTGFKNIAFKEMKYNQSFHSFFVVGGYRFKEKQPKTKRKG